MNIVSKLKYPPLNFVTKQKLPKIVIYQKQYKLLENSDIQVDDFVAFSLKNPSKLAKMKCMKSETFREYHTKVPSLYIWFLRSNSSGQGLGTALINFAEIYSKKIGCKGYLHLSSSIKYSPERIPHIFYRKLGMSTSEKFIDNKLDDFIKKGMIATENDFDTIDMFYPPIEHSKPKRLFKKFDILNKIKNVIGF